MEFRRIFLILILVPALRAQQAPLEMRPLVEEALRNNREILAAQKRLEAARQRPSQQSTRPDPVLSLGYTSNGSPLPLAGLGVEPTSNAGVMVSQEFPFPGKTKLRGEIAGKDAEAEFQNYRAVELSVISRVKQAYHRVHHGYEAVEILERNRDLLGKFIRIAEARYAVGRAAQQDIFKAQSQLAIIETRILKMQADRGSAEAELNSLLNRPPAAPVGRPRAIEPEALAVSLETLNAGARRDAPAVRREQKMVERTELAVNLARKDYYPDYTLSAGYFNQGRLADMYQFRVDFKLPAYFWRKQRQAVTEQTFRVEEARRNYEATNQSLNFRIKGEYLMATTSYRLMQMYRDTVVPQAALALESSIPGYETGAVDFLSLLTNFMTVVEYELNYHEEMQNFFLSVDRLEEMTGLELESGL